MLSQQTTRTSRWKKFTESVALPLLMNYFEWERERAYVCVCVRHENNNTFPYFPIIYIQLFGRISLQTFQEGGEKREERKKSN